MNCVIGYVNEDGEYTDKPFQFFFKTEDVETFWGDEFETVIMFTSGILVRVMSNVEDFLHDYLIMKQELQNDEDIRYIFLN